MARRSGTAAIVLLAALLMPSWARAWGRLGHRVAAEMAEAWLTPPAALAAVRDLLGPGATLADSSTWADEQREIPRSGSWHYVNVPIAESRYDPGYCPAGGCIVSKIGDFERVLRDPKAGRTEKQQALKWVVHLVADLHQSLHVGDTGSRGGNSIQVRFFDRGSNLHRVWDSEIMERQATNEEAWLSDLDLMANSGRAAEWSKGTPEDWATETLQVAKNAYRLPGSTAVMKSGTKLGDEYCRFALPLIQIQLARAAIRIARVLNGIFRLARKNL